MIHLRLKILLAARDGKSRNKKNVSHIYKDSTGSQCTAEAVKAGCTTIGSETARLLNVFPSVSAGATQPAANYGYKNGKRICVKRGKSQIFCFSFC